MIKCISIRDINKEQYDEVWVIVRSLKNPIKNTIQVKHLSPSYDLFLKYLALRDKGQWNKDSFENIYVPQFLDEIKHNPLARNLLNKLFEMDKNGKRIALACFCTDEALCHRSILAGMLAYKGANVVTQNDISQYLKYGALYDAIPIAPYF